MRWIDLLRMSSSNLRRRKLRTFLTVLGVVIGTASIVVMISLGLGMQRSVYQEIEQSGGATGITVRGKNSQDVYMMDSDSDQGEANKYITDNTIEELKKLEHVKSVSPTLELNVILLKGKYYGSVMLVGMDHEALAQQNMKLVKGSRLPEENASSLELVIGNGIPTMFYEKGTDKGYWETGELPDIDFMKDQMFLVLDQDAYYSSQQSGLQESTGTDGESSGTSSTKTIKKQVVHACAMVMEM